MDINALFEKHNTFTANVEVQVPGKGSDKRYKLVAEFRYLAQDQIDALMDGEPLVIDGKTVTDEGGETGDAKILDAVLLGWTGFKVGDEEIEYSEENRKAALRHAPVRTPLITSFFARLSGGGQGGRRGKRRT